ncbi:hypothetical protein HP393_22750 [Clostridioides difficile]|nr:hypothetical protein [Clostridioides difficile]
MEKYIIRMAVIIPGNHKYSGRMPAIKWSRKNKPSMPAKEAVSAGPLSLLRSIRM